LVNRELMRFAPGHAELLYVGKKARTHCADQRAIEALLISYASRGKNVVRLKGVIPSYLAGAAKRRRRCAPPGFPTKLFPVSAPR
jgi:uroporphyrin-III C-methyltransferase